MRRKREVWHSHIYLVRDLDIYLQGIFSYIFMSPLNACILGRFLNIRKVSTISKIIYIYIRYRYKYRYRHRHIVGGAYVLNLRRHRVQNSNIAERKESESLRDGL